MPIRRFPDPRDATPEGVVAIGGDLHPRSLLLAYRQGIFPWPVEGLPLLWFCPPERAVLEFTQLHLPRSLRRARQQTVLRFSIDRAFAAVIRACAAARRPDQAGTWITTEIIAAYTQLHEIGVAHSVEVWRDRGLVGGIYGVDADGAFAAESMFYREPNASKLALLYLIDHLRAGGLDWLDVQVLTPHVQRLGAKLIPRNVFLDKLQRTRAQGLRLFAGN